MKLEGKNIRARGIGMKILFIEPPKDFFFVMGEYLPPPYGIIQLAAFLEKEVKNVDIEILDCNAEQVDWREMEKRIGSSDPDIVASSSLATGSWKRKLQRAFSSNEMKRRVFRHMAGRSLLEQFKSLFMGAPT